MVHLFVRLYGLTHDSGGGLVVVLVGGGVGHNDNNIFIMLGADKWVKNFVVADGYTFSVVIRTVR